MCPVLASEALPGPPDSEAWLPSVIWRHSRSGSPCKVSLHRVGKDEILFAAAPFRAAPSLWQLQREGDAAQAAGLGMAAFAHLDTAFSRLSGALGLPGTW